MLLFSVNETLAIHVLLVFVFYISLNSLEAEPETGIQKQVIEEKFSGVKSGEPV